MKNIYLITIAIISLSTFASCGGKNKDVLTQKKAELKELQKEMSALSIKADKLESEIDKLDSTKTAFFVDVNVDTISSETFKNKVELQGVVESKNTVDISAEASGVIQSISIKQGSRVRKGQVIATLDNSTYQSQIAELRNALSLAQTTSDRQARLFEQGIGTEIQVLQARNRVNDLKQKISTAQTMAAKFVVKAPYSGVIDEVYVSRGEMTGPGMPVARLVNQGDNVIKIQASEKFIGAFKAGDKVMVSYPVLGIKSEEVIQTVGQTIDPGNRSFSIFIKPTQNLSKIKPNLLSIVEVNDFEMPGAITIPTKVIYKLGDKRYVYVVGQNEEGQAIAEKREIVIERSFITNTIVKSGLKANDVIITSGFQNVSADDLLNIIEE
jgi:RND family efflux transporter MFP subunit